MFVDDEETVLTLYRHMFSNKKSDWEIGYAEDGIEALNLMEEEPYDVLVTDMNMPRMNGAELVVQVAEEYPSTARVIITGFSDQKSVIQCLEATHRFLMKPFEVVNLTEIIQTLIALHKSLNQNTLKEFCGQISHLPSSPKIYFQITEELQKPNVTTEKIASLISCDPCMTAKLLQLVNSAFFGFAYEIHHPKDAVQLLGIETVRSLAMLIYVFSYYEDSDKGGISIDELSTHCLQTAVNAQKISRDMKLPSNIQDQAFTAGMLHDLGKLILATQDPDAYRKSIILQKENKLQDWESEQQVFGATHMEIGAYLFSLWGLPVPIIEAIMWHHQPSKEGPNTFSALSAIYVAESLHEFASDGKKDPTDTDMDLEYLLTSGVTENQLDRWKEDSASVLMAS